MCRHRFLNRWTNRCQRWQDPWVLALAQINAALLGLAGTIVGGFITLTSNLVLERRRARREQVLRDEQDRRESRRAVRLILVELETCAQSLASAARTGHYWADAAVRLPTEMWRQYAGLLAVTVADEPWERMARAYAELERLRLAISDASAGLAPGRPPEVTPRDALERVAESIEHAQRALSATVEAPRLEASKVSARTSLPEVERSSVRV